MYSDPGYALYGRGTLAKTDSNGYYLGGYAMVNGSTKPTLVKTDTQGKIVSKQVFANEYGSVRIIDRYHPSEFVFLNNPSNLITKSDIRITKINTTGTVSWSKTYGKQNWDEPYKMIQTSDKGFLILGHSNSLPGIMVPHAYDAYMLKLNQYGDTLWSVMTGDPALNEYAWDAVETVDSQYLVTGNDSQGRILLLKLDAAGNTIWMKKFKNNYQTQPNCIALTSDNCCLIAGTSTPQNTNQSHFYAVKTDSDGTLLWEKTFAAGNENYRPELQILESGFLIAGNNQDDIVLVKATNEGELIWSKILDIQSQGSVSSVDVCEDGGFILTSLYCFTLIKTDSMGCVKPALLAVDGERTVSQNETITFTANDLRGTVYNWSSGRGTITGGSGTAQPHISWENTGIDTLKLVVENECGKDSIELKINILECAPLKLSPIQQSGYFDFYVEKTEGKSPEYSWQVDQGTILSGQHTNRIVVDWKTTGELKVKLKASNDCSIVEDSILFFYDALQSPEEEKIQVYPDPAVAGVFQITNKHEKRILIQVFNSSGQMIETAEPEGMESVQLNFSLYGKGLYILKIIADQKVDTKKLLVQ